MPATWTPILLLVLSNVAMTFAWYGHLTHLKQAPLFLAILASWGVAFIEYCFQVPANRLGIAHYSLPQLKVLQEVISMSVFAAYCLLWVKEPLQWNFLWAAICLALAAYFMFRGVGG